MNEKKRKILHTIFGVIAVASAIVTVLLTPFAKNLLKGDGKAEPTTQAPPTTQAAEEVKRIYTIFIYEKEYSITRENGVTTAIANDNSSVTMVITQHEGKDYATLCNETAQYLSFEDDIAALNTTSPYSAYSATEGAVTTKVYCVDGGDYGSVEIKIQLPENTQKHQKNFDIFLSTFKLL
ncbi:MAG: hypothetical protein E7533_05680 [Ruminococcaceae bacterium]|nr:hypothetical protein [Oscillospiraceae bacterium]